MKITSGTTGKLFLVFSSKKICLPTYFKLRMSEVHKILECRLMRSRFYCFLCLIFLPLSIFVPEFLTCFLISHLNVFCLQLYLCLCIFLFLSVFVYLYNWDAARVSCWWSGGLFTLSCWAVTHTWLTLIHSRWRRKGQRQRHIPAYECLQVSLLSGWNTNKNIQRSSSWAVAVAVAVAQPDDQLTSLSFPSQYHLLHCI